MPLRLKRYGRYPLAQAGPSRRQRGETGLTIQGIGAVVNPALRAALGERDAGLAMLKTGKKDLEIGLAQIQKERDRLSDAPVTGERKLASLAQALKTSEQAAFSLAGGQRTRA
ncbi:MAG: hypothetical protein GDA41_04700 [Rhodospirillales bacterium]|nr:hypothetical protein [Rhodospirillales bacterium]